MSETTNYLIARTIDNHGGDRKEKISDLYNKAKPHWDTIPATDVGYAGKVGQTWGDIVLRELQIGTRLFHDYGHKDLGFTLDNFIVSIITKHYPVRLNGKIVGVDQILDMTELEAMLYPMMSKLGNFCIAVYSLNKSGITNAR